MRGRYIGALVLGALLVAAVTAGAGTSSPSGSSSITVWLQVDAQSGWPGVVAAANDAFKSRHPDVEVKVEYQSWGDHLQKFDAALAGRTAPDVIELGNTETTKYMAARALTDLTAIRRSFPNNQTWLPGLLQSCTYQGRVLCVPYYAGARALIYRKDFYRAAGIKGIPATLDEFIADGRLLMKKYGKDRNFSALYFPGKNWYAAMAFVHDYGGRIAVFQNGRWRGALDSPQAITGLTKVKQVVLALSRASKTGDEANPQQALVFSKGKVASYIGNGWEWPYALDPKVGNPKLAPVMGAYPMPSHIRGRSMPTFLGGSDLAVPVTSENKDLAYDWIRSFTSARSQQLLATEGKQIPNTTTLASLLASNPQQAPFARAAKFSWFVPTSPNWANVESANVLQNMLVSIVTNRATVRAAAQRASRQITQILNASR